MSGLVPAPLDPEATGGTPWRDARDVLLGRMMPDAKTTKIYEGTNQVQRMVVARQPLRG